MPDTKISNLTNYTTPLDADVIPVSDIANTVTKKVTWANIKATLLAFFRGYTTTATAAGTTTLTVASTMQQFFTGTSTQTVTLPVTSTLVLGQTFLVRNLSTGIVTVNSSGANVVLAIPSLTTAIFTCILTSGTTAASWSVSSYLNTPSAGGGGYTLLASVSLSGGAAISLSSGTFAARKVLRIVAFDGGVSASTQVYIRFNGDTGSNYLGNIMRNTTVDGSYTTVGVKTQMANGTIAKYILMDVYNYASVFKRFIGDTQPSSDEMIHFSGYWNNTADQITSVQLSTADGTSTLPTTTTLQIYGMD